MRTPTTIGRRRVPVAVLLAVASVAATLGGPTWPAAAGPTAGPVIVAELGALHDDLAGVVHEQSGGPVPMEEQTAAALKEDLERARSQVDTEPCAAVEAILAFARRTRGEARRLREKISDGGWSADKLTLLRHSLDAVEDLGRRAGTLRARMLTELPGGDRCAGPVDIYVDARRARPRAESLPGLSAGVNRPLASLVDSEGTPADFVADELLISTSDGPTLTAFLDQWGGVVLQKIEPKDGTGQYLVRIDTTRAKPERVADDLASLNGDRTKAESFAVSSQGGLALLAAATSAVAHNKFTVGVNWVSAPHGFGDGNAREAANGPLGFNSGPYNRNSYNWNYLRAGSTQDIGVTAAWTALDSIGKLNNKVPIAVLDRGFATSVDLPASTVLTSSVPFVDPGTQFGGQPRWHGSMVASALASVPDNFVGSAAPAGPVAKPTLIWTSGDMFLTMNAIDLALRQGNRIINMSFGVPVPWPLAFTVLPFDLYTAFIRAFNNVLLFAAAGNSGTDVDATTGWLITWEKTWITPCENSGVICVGGLGEDSLARHPESNFGSEDVNIFAPYVVLIGPDPSAPDASTARSQRGTSLSSPYAAGVAALIWAANPAQHADTVEDILMRTTRMSPDNKVKRRVINAFGAVQDALPATVAIQTPTQGEVLSAFHPAQFRANVFSDGHGTPTVTWRRNGVFMGNGTMIQATLPEGAHTITAAAAFPDGAAAADTIQVTSVDHIPTVHINGPTSPNANTPPVFEQSELIPFHASSLDDLGPLQDSQLRWFLDEASTNFATGHNPVVNTGGAVGPHAVTVIGCDATNHCGSHTIGISIQPNGTNKPPIARITNPANGALLWANGNDPAGFYHELTLTGTVSDPEGAPITVAWFDNGVQIGSTLSQTVKLRAACGNYNHHLVLRATDNAGVSRLDEVDVTVALLC